MNFPAWMRLLVTAIVAITGPLSAVEPALPLMNRVVKEAGKGWRTVVYLDTKGKESGVRTTYDESGLIRLIEQISDDKKDGFFLEYDQSGILRAQGFYLRDLPNGNFITFDAQGNVMTMEKYEAPVTPQ